MTLAERVRAHAREFAQKKRGEEWRKQEKGYWRASTMGLCARQQAYDFLGFKTMRDESTDRSWSLEDGHLHEGDIIERVLQLPGMKKISDNETIKRSFQTRSGVEVKIAGTPDLVLSDGGEKVVVEIKALQDYMFKETVQKNDPPQKYKTQTLVYCLLLGLKKGYLLIKNRNNSDVVSFEVPATKEAKGAVLKRQVKIQKYIDAEKMPPREYELGSQECFYCPHNKRCHEGKTFKGYIHKEGAKKDILVDLDEEPEAQKAFMIAAKTYEKAKRQAEALTGVQNEAKEKLEKLMRKFKADGLSAQGYSAKRITSETMRPDNKVIKELVAAGTIPEIKTETSYVRVDLPRTKKTGAPE